MVFFHGQTADDLDPARFQQGANSVGDDLPLQRRFAGDPKILVGNKPPQVKHVQIHQYFSGLYPTYGHHLVHLPLLFLDLSPNLCQRNALPARKNIPKKSAATLRQVEGSAQGALCAAQPFRVAGAFWQDPPHGCRRSFFLSFLKIHIEIIDL